MAADDYAQLETADMHLAIPLFAGLSELQVSAGAVLQGEAEGRVLVDDAMAPRSGMVTSPEGTYFAGVPVSTAFSAALGQYLWEELYGRSGWDMIFATVDRPGWLAPLAEIVAPRRLLAIARRHYVIRALDLDWRAAVPDGYDVVPIDEALLGREDIDHPDHLWGWIRNNWSTPRRYLERGFGCATLRERKVVSWSLADCRYSKTCEIGIQTLPEERLQGLATVTAAATVELALNVGFESVGWHCHEYNVGSRRTAEKVGFELERRYHSHYAYAQEAEELAELGWMAYRRGHYDQTVALYRRVFKLQPDAPDYKYHLAAVANAATGDFNRAFEYLHSAIDRGWTAAAHTRAQPEFEPLHDDPRWMAALGRMAEARPDAS